MNSIMFLLVGFALGFLSALAYLKTLLLKKKKLEKSTEKGDN